MHGAVATNGFSAVAMVIVFVALGLGAGVLTTVAGQGGGLLLLLACSSILGPHRALAITTPALLLGNLHRALLLRTAIDRPVAVRMIAGVLPGALLGGLSAGVIPAWTLRVVLVGISSIAIAKAIGWLRFRVRRGALIPAGFLVGGATGAAGGAGVLFAPLLLSVGLSGRAYVATSSAAAFAAHAGRMAGYATFGLFTRSLLGPTVAVSLAIFAGNALGDRLAARILGRSGRGRSGPRFSARFASFAEPLARLTPEGRAKLIEHGTLVVCVALSVAGLG